VPYVETCARRIVEYILHNADADGVSAREIMSVLDLEYSEFKRARDRLGDALVAAGTGRVWTYTIDKEKAQNWADK
jgi:hypothetical protein